MTGDGDGMGEVGKRERGKGRRTALGASAGETHICNDGGWVVKI